MMKSVFLCALNNIACNDLSKAITLNLNEINESFPILKITNKLSDIKTYLNRGLKEAIGNIEYEYLTQKAPLIAFCESCFDENVISPIEYLDEYLCILSSFLFGLWSIKDNAVDFELGFLQYQRNYGYTTHYSSNRICVTRYDCKGECSNVTFSTKELNQAAIFLRNNMKIETERIQSVNIQNHHRITIANYYIQNARNCSDLGLKITSYCSCLECLFLNDSTELSHKLSERVALFLSKNKEDRIHIFKILKQAYSFRSKVVHGDRFKTDKIKELTMIVQETDEICRKVMNYAFNTKEYNVFDLGRDKHEEYFIDLLMNI